MHQPLPHPLSKRTQGWTLTCPCGARQAELLQRALVVPPDRPPEVLRLNFLTPGQGLMDDPLLLAATSHGLGGKGGKYHDPTGSSNNKKKKKHAAGGGGGGKKAGAKSKKKKH